jgi:hypothetical protein
MKSRLPPDDGSLMTREDGFVLDRSFGVRADDIGDIELLPSESGQLRVRVLVERDVVEAVRRRMRRRMIEMGIFDV